MSSNSVMKPASILIVDDDPAMLRALSLLAETYGKTTTANGMRKAIDLLKAHSFDLVLTDYELGDGSGLDVLQFAHSISSNLPVILITAFGNKELVIKTLNYQVFGFAEKPFDPAVVEELIQRALEKKQRQDSITTFATLGESAGQLVHEITNPLTLITLKIDLLKELAAEAGDTDLLTSAAKLSESTQRINDIINWTKSSLRETNQVKMEPLQMREILDLLRQECVGAANANQVQIIITAGSDVKITGDKSQLLAVFVNLVKNGIEAVAGYQEKWVLVNVQNRGEMVEISITDSGPGIPEAIRSKLFTPLFTTKAAGTGLGLIIVRKIIRNHGGTIFLNEKDKNTQFIINLPTRL